MTTAFEAYREYLSLKRHFTSDYDYVKYSGRINASEKSFDARNDKIFFEKLAKHKDLKNYIIANLLVNPKIWVKELAYSATAEKTYSEWQRRQQSLSYIFGNELAKLNPDFDSNLVIKDNEHPPLLLKYITGEVCIETVIAILRMTGCVKHWNAKMADDPVWEDAYLKIKKYSPFAVINVDKLKNIVIQNFSAAA